MSATPSVSRGAVRVSRRGVLAGAAGLVAAGMAPRRAAAAAGGFRLIFLPCIHLRTEPRYRSPEGFATALRAALALDPRPSLLLTGGDICHDLRSQTLDEATRRADLFLELVAEHGGGLPIHHCLGNHEPLGWGSGTVAEDHPDFGYGLMRRKLGLERLYHSFDHGGWHFVALHNVKLTEPGQFTGEWDAEQLEFLRDDLARHRDQPTIVFAHIPAVSAVEFFAGRARGEEGNWILSQNRATANPHELVAAFDAGGGNVKAVLSGHIHRLDRIQVAGYQFICSGAVGGAQWRGPDHGCPEGFGVIDCRPDGSIDYRYQTYGWEASPEARG